jgi:hypothetical protein
MDWLYFHHHSTFSSILNIWESREAVGPPVWSSGQSSLLQIQRSRVRFLALPDFLSISGSWTGSTQPREDNWGATWKDSSGSGLNPEINGRGDSLRWPRDTLYPLNLALNSPISGGRSVGIVRWRTKPPERREAVVCFAGVNCMMLRFIVTPFIK